MSNTTTATPRRRLMNAAETQAAARRLANELQDVNRRIKRQLADLAAATPEPSQAEWDELEALGFTREPMDLAKSVYLCLPDPAEVGLDGAIKLLEKAGSLTEESVMRDVEKTAKEGAERMGLRLLEQFGETSPRGRAVKQCLSALERESRVEVRRAFQALEAIMATGAAA